MRILFLDTETGGLDETQYDLLSVGMVVWEDNKIIDTKEILISKAEYKTDPEAMKVNGLDLLTLQKNGISELMAIEEIEKFCDLYFSHDRVVLAGQNISFDEAFLKKLYRDHHYNYGKRFSHKKIDTVAILKFLYLQGKISEEMQSFEEALKQLGIEVNKEIRHTALGDAILTATLFTSLITIENAQLSTRKSKKI